MRESGCALHDEKESECEFHDEKKSDCAFQYENESDCVSHDESGKLFVPNDGKRSRVPNDESENDCDTVLSGHDDASENGDDDDAVLAVSGTALCPSPAPAPLEVCSPSCDRRR